MTALTDTDPNIGTEDTAATGQTAVTEAPKPATKKRQRTHRLSLADLAAGLSGQVDMPIVDAAPESKPSTTQSNETSTGVAQWLADASHWLPRDEDVLDIPSIRVLTAEHRSRVNKSSSALVRGSGQTLAAATLACGYVLNVASLAIATTAILAQRAVLDTATWKNDSVSNWRPRGLAEMSSATSARARGIKNRWVRAHYTFLACLARRYGQIANALSYHVAQTGAGLNDPRRIASGLMVGTTLVTIAALVAVAW